jgi:hypothetical protein
MLVKIIFILSKIILLIIFFSYYFNNLYKNEKSKNIQINALNHIQHPDKPKQNIFSQRILQFNEKNFEIITTNSSYDNKKRYNNNNVILEAHDGKDIHSIYGDYCKKCQKLIGEFKFKNYGNIICPGYPRLYRLSDYWNNTWLLGGNIEDGKIYVQRSYDEGLNWDTPIPISFYPEHICSNVNFFELQNHDIISSYRAIGNLSSDNPDIKYNRKLCSSISYDGGKTWENFGIIVDNFELAIKLGKTKEKAYEACFNEFKIGFFEPFVEDINGDITVFYADDFTIMVNQSISSKTEDNYRAQNIYTQILDINNKKWSSERKVVMDGTKKRKPTGSEIKERISRDGMPTINKMKNGKFVMVFEGTYRDRRYPLLTGEHLDEYHSFEILLSYSDDGIVWSNPVEIYTSHYNLSKASAPYVVSTDNNQLIISFQTDEDSLPNGYRGDMNSIMKVMISKPNIDVKDINKDSFYALCNNNNSPINGTSIWNGMMIVNNILYTFSSDNTIKYSEIPIYTDPNLYSLKLRNEYYIKKGNISTYGNKIIVNHKNTLVINKKINTYFNNIFYFYVTPNDNYDCGIIFGFNNFDYPKLIKDKYFKFIINKEGYLVLSKIIKGINIEIIKKKCKYIYHEFDKRNTYKLTIKYLPYIGKIIVSVNENKVFDIFDNSLNGRYIGLETLGNGTIFSQILVE